MSFQNTYQKQVEEYGGGGGEGGLLTITKNVVTSGTKTYLNFEIPFGVTQFTVTGQWVLASPFLGARWYVQFSSDGVVYSTPLEIATAISDWVNTNLYTSTLGIFWRNQAGLLVETLVQVPTTARVYIASNSTPSIAEPLANLTSVNIVTTSFP